MSSGEALSGEDPWALAWSMVSSEHVYSKTKVTSLNRETVVKLQLSFTRCNDARKVDRSQTRRRIEAEETLKDNLNQR